MFPKVETAEGVGSVEQKTVNYFKYEVRRKKYEGLSKVRDKK